MCGDVSVCLLHSSRVDVHAQRSTDHEDPVWHTVPPMASLLSVQEMGSPPLEQVMKIVLGEEFSAVDGTTSRSTVIAIIVRASGILS